MTNKCCKNEDYILKNLRNGLGAMSDDNRLRILCLLTARKKLCVCEICKILELPQNLTSYHLNKLKEAGFLESKKEGAKVIYQKGKGVKLFLNLIKIISE